MNNSNPFSGKNWNCPFCEEMADRRDYVWKTVWRKWGTGSLVELDLDPTDREKE